MGWPLLGVETEVNRDSKCTNERGPSLVGSLGLLCRYKRFLFCLGCFSRPSTKYCFPTVHYSKAFGPIVQQAGQAVVLDRLSLTSYLTFAAAVRSRRGRLLLLEGTPHYLVYEGESHPGVGTAAAMEGPPTGVGGQDLRRTGAMLGCKQQEGYK